MFWKPTYHQSDEQLMKRVQAGRQEAFEQLYERYHRKMFRYFHRRLNRNESLAQDMLHDLFVRVMEKSQQFDTKRSFSAWLYTIAGNMCKNSYRRQEVRQATVSIEEEIVGGYEVDLGAKLDRASFQEGLTEALETLSDKHREAFLLRFQQELSIKEIAKITGSAEGTIKSRLFYALKKLSKELAAFGH